MTDGGRWGETPVEVHTFDDGIHREDVEAIPLRLDHGRIVADAHGEPGGRGQQFLLNPGDQLALGEIGDGHLA
jgi:hypothetical protein